MVIAIASGIDGVTPEWLSAAIGRRVTEVRTEQIAQDSGFSSRAGQAMAALGGYARGVAFYRHVAERAVATIDEIDAPEVFA